MEFCGVANIFVKSQSLSLAKNLEELLELQSGDVTGLHDLAHNMQLSYADVFIDHKTGDKEMKKYVSRAQSLMSEYNCGKNKTAFDEFRAKYTLPSLTMKNQQETRFVRSHLRFCDTVLRVLVSIYRYSGEQLLDVVRSATQDNTSGKALLDIQAKCADGNFITMIHV